ncbi:MAG: nucleotide exchange factor GrpE [Chloroflexota bacterium]|nr:nucleotide exchange factor GrpE [Chloroflexota bacterium]
MTKKKDKVAVTEEVVVEAEVVEQVEEIAEVEPLKGEGTLEDELERTRAQAAEYLDGWQRTQAEFSNYKKRQEADRVQMMALANATLLRKLLPVVDDFDRALDSLPVNLSQLTWCEGISMIKYKLDAVLESEGVKPIVTDGQAFDPHFHEAVTHEQVPGYEEGQIIGEVQRGYTLGERVLRHALVRVAKAPAPQPLEDGDTTESFKN